MIDQVKETRGGITDEENIKETREKENGENR